MSAVKTGIAGILWFTGFLSINLGVINLLPLFITDGWVLLMLLIEKIRGKALSIQRQVLIQQVGIGFFILLFVLVTYNDILRLVTNSF
jgi:regulator of sigma E protease